MIKILVAFWNSCGFITDSIFANIRFLWKILLGCNVFSLILRIMDISGFSLSRFSCNVKPLPCLEPSQYLPISVSVKIPKYLRNEFFCSIFLKRYTRNFKFLEVLFWLMLKKRLPEKVMSCFPERCLPVIETTSTIIMQCKVAVTTT